MCAIVRPSLLLAFAAGLAGQEAVSPAPRPWRIGVLFWHDSPNDAEALRGIRNALEARGHPHELLVEAAGSDREAAYAILDGFVASDVDLIVALGTEAALRAKERVRGIPVVFTAVTNPVESGVVAAWEGSGTHLAGNSNWIEPETIVRVFRLAVPHLRRLGVLRSERSEVVSAAELRGVRRYLQEPEAPPIEIVEAVVEGEGELGPAVDELLAQGVDAIWIGIDNFVYSNMETVFGRARVQGVPLLTSSLRGTRAGAVAGVVVDYEMLGEQAVVIALEVLEKGRDPGTLPIGTMRGYRVVVNLAAAAASDYELPLSLLVIADVILDSLDAEPGDGR